MGATDPLGIGDFEYTPGEVYNPSGVTPTLQIPAPRADYVTSDDLGTPRAEYVTRDPAIPVPELKPVGAPASLGYYSGPTFELLGGYEASSLAGGGALISLPSVEVAKYADLSALAPGTYRATLGYGDAGSQKLSLSSAVAGAPETRFVPQTDGTFKPMQVPAVGGNVDVVKAADGSVTFKASVADTDLMAALRQKSPTYVPALEGPEAPINKAVSGASTQVVEDLANSGLATGDAVIKTQLADGSRVWSKVAANTPGARTLLNAETGLTGWSDAKDPNAWTTKDWIAIAPTLVSLVTLAGQYFLGEKSLRQQAQLAKDNRDTQLEMLGMQLAASQTGSGGGSGGSLKAGRV